MKPIGHEAVAPAVSRTTADNNRQKAEGILWQQLTGTMYAETSLVDYLILCLNLYTHSDCTGPGT